ncbi:penicillin-binding protein activator [Tropicimonas sp. S265A]|uniref:penicillin-binding protein activator n=1 Tax=Tropicimonas sp. S265A TaxID=3415134 RepID=UPI003C7C8E33
MLPAFSKTRKALRISALSMGAALVLAACDVPATGGGPSINASAPVPVALLVPYGSENAAETGLAQSLENAARLAMADLNGVEVDLKVYATAGNPDQAATVAREAVRDGAKIILGPVYGASANAAGVAVSSARVNVLSFSNNTEIAGGNVFVLGNTFDNTARRVVSYANSQGRSSMVVTYPETAVGVIGRDAVTNAIASSGAGNAGTIGYEASQNGVINAVREIADLVRDNGAQALVIADDTSGGVPLLSQLLLENGVDPTVTQLVGLTRWDIPPSTLDLPGVQGGLFALPDPGPTSQFQSRYQSAYGAPPHPIAGLAYDGMAAIGALVASDGSSALTTSALTQGAGFAGVSGVFRFRADGTNERALAVAQIVDRQVTIVSPAPKSFSGAGF